MGQDGSAWVGAFACAAWVVGLSACGDEATGSVEVTVYGEDFIEVGIPAEAMQDGWSVSFERFEIELSDVLVAGKAVAVEGPIELARPTDGRGQRVGSVAVAAGELGAPEFSITDIRAEGTASRGAEVKRFVWRFEQSTRYSACVTTIRVAEGGSAQFQITVHADHLFYDSLVAERPALLFQALADADTDADGDITSDELVATELGAYDPGSDDRIEDLWAFLVAQAGTLGHVDGEGHCAASAIAP